MEIPGRADVTIVVVPRERFSYAEASLESLYAETTYPFSLIYVDAGSPRPLRRALERAAAERGFERIHHDDFLSPNAARNLGLARVRTRYVAFVDNDVVVTPGWLEALVRCAEETGASVVGPLYLEGALEDRTIHMAGGSLTTERGEGPATLYEHHLHAGDRIDDVTPPLSRTPCDVIEFHTVLVRTAIFDRIGPLDERMLNTREHVDFCMSVTRSGGTVYFEPDSVITYMPPLSLRWSDLPFYLARWGERSSTETLRHFVAKWEVALDPRQMDWLRSHRHLFLEPIRPYLRRLFGDRSEKVEQIGLHRLEIALNRLLFAPLRSPRASRPAAAAVARVAGRERELSS